MTKKILGHPAQFKVGKTAHPLCQYGYYRPADQHGHLETVIFSCFSFILNFLFHYNPMHKQDLPQGYYSAIFLPAHFSKVYKYSLLKNV